MNSLINYTIESVIVMGCLTLVYEMLFKKEKCFSYNRFFLLLIPIFAIIIPFFSFPFFPGQHTPIDFVYRIPTLISEVTTVVEPKTTVAPTVKAIIVFIYGLGVLGSLVIFIVKIAQLKALIKRNDFTKKHLGDYTIVLTEGKLPTFTFLNYLFLDNSNLIEAHDIDQIVRHEETHIRQRHSYDIILMEILGIVLWFNPFIYLIKKSVKENHEFLADEKAKELVGTRQYAMLLIKQVAQGNKIPLANFFSMALTKKRIHMLTNSARNSKGSLAKPLLIIPILATIIFLFSFKTIYKKSDTRQYMPAQVLKPPASFREEAIRLSKKSAGQKLLFYGNTRFYS